MQGSFATHRNVVGIFKSSVGNRGYVSMYLRLSCVDMSSQDLTSPIAKHIALCPRNVNARADVAPEVGLVRELAVGAVDAEPRARGGAAARERRGGVQQHEPSGRLGECLVVKLADVVAPLAQGRIEEVGTGVCVMWMRVRVRLKM